MWRFLWYPDGTSNPWQSWYDRQDQSVRGRHDNVIRLLSGQPVWRRPYAEKLAGYDGLIEIIITAGVAHRLFGFYGVNRGDFTIVLPCTHNAKKYNPRNAFEVADARMKEVFEGKVVAVLCGRPRSS